MWVLPVMAIVFGIARFWLYAGNTSWIFDCAFVIAAAGTIAIGLSFLAGRASKDLDRSLYSNRQDTKPIAATPKNEASDPSRQQSSER